MASVKNPITGTKHDVVSVAKDLANLVSSKSSAKQKLGGAAGVVGTVFGLPEMGISEKLEGVKVITPPKEEKKKVNNNTIIPPKEPENTPPKEPENKFKEEPVRIEEPSSNSSKSSSSGGSSKSSSSSSKSSESLKKSAEESARKAAEAEKERIDAWEKAQRGEITSAYDDIFRQLDSLLAQYPSQREEMLGYVENMAEAQRGLAGSEKERALSELSAQEEKQRGLAKSSLRDLDEDIRNSLMAAGRYLGIRGAGDSSSSSLASEALSRAGQKARSNVLSTRDQAIAEIGRRANDVKKIASEQLLNIEQFKANKALDIMNFFQNKMEALEAERRNATAERGRALAQIIQNTQGQFIEAMRKLDAETRNYKQSIDLWQAQRTAEMEDYAQKLAAQKSYSGPTSGSYNQALSLFDSLVSRGIPSEQARQIANEQTGIFLPEGLQRENEYGGIGSPSELFLGAEAGTGSPYDYILGKTEVPEDPFQMVGL